MVKEEFSNDMIISLFIPFLGGYWMHKKWIDKDQDLAEFLFNLSLVIPVFSAGAVPILAASRYFSYLIETIAVFLIPVICIYYLTRRINGNPYQNLFLSSIFNPSAPSLGLSYGEMEQESEIVFNTWQWFLAKFLVITMLPAFMAYNFFWM